MKTTPLLLAALLLAPVSLQAAPAGSSGRERVRFDDGWKFHLQDPSLGESPSAAISGAPLNQWRWKMSENPTAETTDAVRPELDASTWSAAQAGQNVIGKENSFAWFRATLPQSSVPLPRLHFESVDDNATVYLNGQKLAQHSGWDSAFDVPLGSAWKAGGPNVVAVLVENVGGAGGIGAAFLQPGTPLPPPPPALSGPASANFSDAAWRGVHLPHDFIIEGRFDPQADASHGFLPKGAGWYRKSFVLPASDRGKALWLEFDGVYRDSIVWLNGQQLGRHRSGYTSFHYDISRAARYGGQNTLAVFADASQNEGWWYEGGGIYRHVYLTKLAPLHVAHWGTSVVATPSSDFKSAQIDIGITVENHNKAAAPCSVDTVILDPSGKAVAALRGAGALVAPGEHRVAGPRLSLANPRLWSPDSPSLYTLRTTLRQRKKIVDQTSTTFGIRSLRWDANLGFFLNGKPFKIQGTCNHQDFAGIGVALPDRVSYYKVEKLKEMGCNALRFSHHPMAPELLEACDRLGMVVLDENRRLGDSPEVLGQVQSMVRRDRNHPSIIMWSMCNEESLQGSEQGAKMFAAMKNVVLRWDKTRPVTGAMNAGFGGGISLVTDVQGFNYNTGAYDDFHRKFPNLPLYGSETASETTTRGIYADDREKGYTSTYKGTHQAAWQPIAERPWMAGGFVWTGFDYRGEPTPYQWPDVNSHFGIMDTCGFPKDSYYYYRAWWGSQPVAHILPHWNWAGREGQPITVWVHGNATRYELLLNGASLGTKEMPRYSHLEWSVPYAPGTLEARGYNSLGRQIVADKVETAGAPARLEIVPDRARLLADGEDVIMVRCNVLDAQNRVVPTAGNAVSFAVSGSARVAGVGNGDPSDHDPDKASQRRAFNGHCLAIVQSDGRAGSVTLTATSPGLRPATISLRAVSR